MWHDGYVTELDYTFGYYKELNPALLKLATNLAGFHHCVPENPTYLELGFGQGISINCHAASHNGIFWGNDFNASQASFARELAENCGSNATLTDDSFAELAAREDLPDFDIIVLHGIWTWISDENRAHIIDIARRHLKPGGLFYVSYNTTPGWSPGIPLRHLLTEHARHSSSGNMESKINNSIEFIQKIIDADSLYFTKNPDVKETFKVISNNKRNYLAHEYMNANWDVMPFSKVANLLSAAKLQFATSANISEQIDVINLTAEAQAVLDNIENDDLRQTTRDYFVNRQFRGDIFIKGARRLAKPEQYEIVKNIKFVLLISPEHHPSNVKSILGTVTLNSEVYEPIVQILSEDNYKPKSIHEILGKIKSDKIGYSEVLQAMTMMCGMGTIQPTLDSDAHKGTIKKAKALNKIFNEKARFSDDIKTLAAPLIGGGIKVNRTQQLFILALEEKVKDVPSHVWNFFKQQGLKLIKDEVTLQSDDENLAEMKSLYEDFIKHKLPILNRLGVTSANR